VWIARAKGFSLAGSDSRRSPEWGRLMLVPRSVISQPRAITAFLGFADDLSGRLALLCLSNKGASLC